MVLAFILVFSLFIIHKQEKQEKQEKLNILFY